jgi:hypothetical protein
MMMMMMMMIIIIIIVINNYNCFEAGNLSQVLTMPYL